MIEVDVLYAERETFREPSVDESGPSLIGSCFVTCEGDEMDTRIPIVVVYRESGYGLISMITDVTPDTPRIDTGEFSIVFDVIGFEKVTDFGTGKYLNKGLGIDRFNSDFGVGEELSAGSLRSLIPFFVVLPIIYLYESGAGKVRIDGESTPSGWDVLPLEGYPDDHPTGPSVRFQKFSSRLGVDAFELGELDISTDNIFDPPESRAILKGDGSDTTMSTEILIVDTRSCPIIGMICRVVVSLDNGHRET